MTDDVDVTLAAVADLLHGQVPEWWSVAACRGLVDTMFSESAEGVGRALTVCARCPVREPCDRGARERGEQHGVWGGVYRGARRKLRDVVA